MTVAEMLARMSLREWNDWQRYFACEPTLRERIEVGFGINTCAVYRAGGSKSATPAQFIPKYEDQEPTQEELEIKLARVLGG